MLMLVEIFCCYARKDQSLLNELKIHLIPLKRQGLITIWADTDIDAGIEWDKEALAAYEQALQHIPDDAFVQDCKSFTLYDLERYEEALAACERSIELYRNDSKAYIGKANAQKQILKDQEKLRKLRQGSIWANCT